MAHPEESREAVRVLYEQGVSYPLIEQATGVPRDTIQKWGIRYKWQRSLDGRKHTPETRAACKHLWETSELNQTEIGRRYGVTRATLLAWSKEEGWAERPKPVTRRPLARRGLKPR